MSKVDLDLDKKCWEAASKAGAVAWRNNQGLATYGRVKVKYGVGKGGSDYLGFVPVPVECLPRGMVVPVFLALEVKPRGASWRPGQKDFLRKIAHHPCGAKGIAVVGRDPKQVEQVLIAASEGVHPWGEVVGL